MKNVICFWGTMVILALAVAARAADGLTQTLQHGLYEEEANQNLDAAIKAYQSVVAQSEEQRKVAATALFRLGECYRKLGKTNEASAQYQRIIRDFSEQEQLVKLSRENVAKVGGSAASSANAGQPETNPEAEELARIRAMVKDSPDLVNRRADGKTPLHTAAERGFLSVAEFLLANGANVNAENDSHETPLHRAAYTGRKRMVELLLEHLADVDRRNGLGGTPLYYAALNGYKGIVQVLLAHKADVNAVTSDYGEQPLHAAAADGYAAVAEVLLDHGAELERQSSSGRRGTTGTPLHLAAARGQAEVVRLLLQHKANVNSINGNSSTPLHAAASNGHRDIVEILLKGKADVNATDYEGDTALDRAAQQGRTEVVKTLLDSGADPNIQNRNGESALFGIANIDVMKLLLKYKADPNLKSRSGATPLSSLMNQSPVPLDAIEAILKHGADSNSHEERNGSPLLFSALTAGNFRLVELLLNHQADPNFLVSGETPLSFAARARVANQANSDYRLPWERIEKLLLDHGANENLQRLSTISFRRPGWSTPTTLFTRGTNDLNRYTLFEFLAALYAHNPKGPKYPYPPEFPDLAHLTINGVNQARILRSDIGDWSQHEHNCSDDISLEWGDVITIPEQDHPLSVPWWGIGNRIRELLTDCMTRQVQLIIKQETNTVTLAPQFAHPVGEVSRKAQRPQGRPELTLPVFRLNQVIYGSGLLRTSSDLSRVHVTRTDPANKQKQAWTVDLTRLGPNEKSVPTNIAYGQDLWLRDGDVIEIPEKR